MSKKQELVDFLEHKRGLVTEYLGWYPNPVTSWPGCTMVTDLQALKGIHLLPVDGRLASFCLTLIFFYNVQHYHHNDIVILFGRGGEFSDMETIWFKLSAQKYIHKLWWEVISLPLCPLLKNSQNYLFSHQPCQDLCWFKTLVILHGFWCEQCRGDLFCILLTKWLIAEAWLVPGWRVSSRLSVNTESKRDTVYEHEEELLQRSKSSRGYFE